VSRGKNAEDGCSGTVDYPGKAVYSSCTLQGIFKFYGYQMLIKILICMSKVTGPGISAYGDE